MGRERERARKVAADLWQWAGETRRVFWILDAARFSEINESPLLQNSNCLFVVASFSLPGAEAGQRLDDRDIGPPGGGPPPFGGPPPALPNGPGGNSPFRGGGAPGHGWLGPFGQRLCGAKFLLVEWNPPWGITAAE